MYILDKIIRTEGWQKFRKLAKKHLIAWVRDRLIADNDEFKGAFDITDPRDYNYDDFA